MTVEVKYIGDEDSVVWGDASRPSIPGVEFDYDDWVQLDPKKNVLHRHIVRKAHGNPNFLVRGDGQAVEAASKPTPTEDAKVNEIEDLRMQIEDLGGTWHPQAKAKSLRAKLADLRAEAEADEEDEE